MGGAIIGVARHFNDSVVPVRAWQQKHCRQTGDIVICLKDRGWELNNLTSVIHYSI